MEVEYIDYGFNNEWKTINELFCLEINCAKLPQQCIHCELLGLPIKAHYYVLKGGGTAFLTSSTIKFTLYTVVIRKR